MPFSSVVGINLDTVLPSTALKLVSGYGTGALDVRKSKFLVQPATCATINPNMAQHLCHGHLRLAECMGSVLCMVPWLVSLMANMQVCLYVCSPPSHFLLGGCWSPA